LGYRFEAGQRWVRDKSLKALKDRIRSKNRRNEGQSLKQVIASLNPMLGGWFTYFKHAHPYVFERLDNFIRRGELHVRFGGRGGLSPSRPLSDAHSET
jgi:RNA-directed DNA polymerase